MQAEKKIILFDGECNFCNSTVNFIILHDPSGLFRFASLNSEIGNKLLKEYSVEPTDSIVLIEQGKAYTHSTAILRILKNLKGLWKLLYVFILVPKPLRDFLYRAFAKNRYKLFGQSCMIPTPEIKERFLS